MGVKHGLFRIAGKGLTYVTMLKAMLRAQGCAIRHQKLLDLLDFVNKTCPWFAEEGTVNVETGDGREAT